MIVKIKWDLDNIYKYEISISILKTKSLFDATRTRAITTTTIKTTATAAIIITTTETTKEVT